MVISALLLGDPQRITHVYGPQQMERLKALVSLHKEILTQGSLLAEIQAGLKPEVILSTWGMPRLTDEELDAMPQLKLVLYAAGDVRAFAEPIVARGIPLVSAWRANAIPVAQFALAQILLAAKGWWGNVTCYKSDRHRRDVPVGPGCHELTVALIGGGAISRLLISHLKPFGMRILLVDPYLSDSECQTLGVEKVSLEEAFSQAFIVSNHVPDNEETRDMIGAEHFRLLPQGGAFINTGRGRTLRNEEFIQTFQERPDLTALLDVTHPEPLPSDSPLWDMPNIHVSSHIAGAIGAETRRMADLCLDELERWLKGEPLQHLVEPGALKL